MKQDEFDSFFSQYSANVDNADRQAFWRFSDELVERIIRRYLSSVPKRGTILDAGGGTARWALRLSKLTEANFIVYDKSRDMLEKAKANTTRSNLNNQIRLIEGDLEHITSIEEESVDFVYSTYGVISFIENPTIAFRELHRILKPGGALFVMGHGYANALASKLNGASDAPSALLALLTSGKVKWAPHVPYLHTFSGSRLKSLMSEAGFNNENQYGVPIFLQPGPEDFDPTNKKRSQISKALEDPEFYRAAFEIELQHCADPFMVNRGVNLIAVGIK